MCSSVCSFMRASSRVKGSLFSKIILPKTKINLWFKCFVYSLNIKCEGKSAEKINNRKIQMQMKIIVFSDKISVKSA